MPSEARTSPWLQKLYLFHLRCQMPYRWHTPLEKFFLWVLVTRDGSVLYLILLSLSCSHKAIGIKVDPTLTYTASFFYRFPQTSTFTGNAVVGFQTASGLSLGSASVAIKGTQTSWLQVTTTFKPAQAPPNNNNWFSITLSGSAAAGQTINFAMLSVFPPTFNNRPSGLRTDIVTVSNICNPANLPAYS